MEITYFDIEKNKDDFMKANDTRTNRDFNGHLVNVINGKIRLVRDIVDFKEIHLDSETLLSFLDILRIDPKDICGHGPVITSFMGYSLFQHFPDHRYISLFDGMEEVGRIYLITESAFREERLGKFLDN